MIRLPELSGAAAAAERWDQRSFDILTAVQTARTLRSQFIADHLGSTLTAFARWWGLRGLFVALRRRVRHRRTLKALTQLDDRVLRDIGVSRADIAATATFCCQGQAEESASVWQRLSAWIVQERRRRETVRALSAMPEELLTDIGIARAEIPSVAAALVAGERAETAGGRPTEAAQDVPVSAQVLAFVEVRRSLQHAANQNVTRPAA